MGWQDPSPRARARSSGGSPAAQPGYGDAGPRLSFAAIMVRALVALLVGGAVYVGAHKGLGGWLGPAHAWAAVAIPAALALAVGWLALRASMRMPEGDGRRGWFGRRRGWDDSSGLTFGEAVAADAIGDVVGVIVDAATD